MHLKEEVFRFCQDGIDLMKESIDPIHDDGHVLRLLEILDRFLIQNQEIQENQIDFEVLLVAICWHDAWRSRKFPGYWLPALWQFFWEGMGSRRLFVREAKEIGLEKGIINPVRYAIRKHSRFQFLSTKTLEAKILRDMDSLEFWSKERIIGAAREAERRGLISKASLGSVKLYLKAINWINRSKFYFEWSRQEIIKMKQGYLDQAQELLDYYGQKYKRKQP